MNNEKDELKECIAREFEKIAKEEEESLEKDTSLVVPEGTKEAVLARLKEQMREYQREQAENEAREREEAINNLSEEDRKALELGRKMLKAEVGTADTSEKKVHYRRKYIWHWPLLSYAYWQWESPAWEDRKELYGW